MRKLSVFWLTCAVLAVVAWATCIVPKRTGSEWWLLYLFCGMCLTAFGFVGSTVELLSSIGVSSEVEGRDQWLRRRLHGVGLLLGAIAVCAIGNASEHPWFASTKLLSVAIGLSALLMIAMLLRPNNARCSAVMCLGVVGIFLSGLVVPSVQLHSYRGHWIQWAFPSAVLFVASNMYMLAANVRWTRENYRTMATAVATIAKQRVA
jgi:hypothetical protein